MTDQEKQAIIEAYDYEVFPVLGTLHSWVAHDPLDNDDGWSVMGSLSDVLNDTMEHIAGTEPPTGPLSPGTPAALWVANYLSTPNPSAT